jgi:presenilin-like A22 family membrane protease
MRLRVSFILLFSFALALFSGLLVGRELIFQQVSFVEDSASVANAGYLFLYIVFATAVMLVLLHYYKGKKLFLAAELLLEFSSMQILLSLFLDATVAFVLAVLLVLLRLLKPGLKQPLLFASCVVVGALLGSSLDLVPAVVLSALLAAYDYFAVFRSKHMVTLAKELGKRQAAFAIEFKTAPWKGKEKPRVKKEGGAAESVLLGTGDFVIPIMICVSVLKTSVFSAVVTALGAFVGLSVLLYVMEKTRGYYPALPPIVLFSALFYSASLLFA